MRLLKDLDVKFISLVRRPANRKEKLILKDDGGFELLIDLEKAHLNEEDRVLYGVVYAPNELDAHGDYTTGEEIKKAAWNFLKEGRVRNVDVEHTYKEAPAFVAESWLSKGNDPLFPEEPENTWIVGIRVEDEKLWEEIKRGEYRGLSLAGTARVVEKSGKYRSFAKTDWPVAASDTPWDGREAKKRLLDKGGWDLLSRCVAAVEMEGDELPENLDNYKFPYCDVIGGQVKIVPNAVKAAKGFLNGAFGVEIEPQLEEIARRVISRLEERVEQKRESKVKKWISGIFKGGRSMEKQELKELIKEVLKEIEIQKAQEEHQKQIEERLSQVAEKIESLQKKVEEIEKSRKSKPQDQPADKSETEGIV